MICNSCRMLILSSAVVVFVLAVEGLLARCEAQQTGWGAGFGVVMPTDVAGDHLAPVGFEGHLFATWRPLQGFALRGEGSLAWVPDSRGFHDHGPCLGVGCGHPAVESLLLTSLAASLELGRRNPEKISSYVLAGPRLDAAHHSTVSARARLGWHAGFGISGYLSSGRAWNFEARFIRTGVVDGERPLWAILLPFSLEF